MRKIFQLLLVLSSVNSSFAQIQGADSQSNMSSLSGGGMFRSFDNRFKGIEGSPLLFEKYLSGKILLTSGADVNQKKINYDAYTQELIIDKQGKEFLLDAKLIKGFYLFKDGDTLFFEKFNTEKNKLVFYQNIQRGKINLFKSYSKTIQQPTNSGAYSAGKTYSQFEQVDIFYFQPESGKLQIIKNKKSILNSFPAQKNDVEKFLDENNINLKEETDLVKLFYYMNNKINSSGD